MLSNAAEGLLATLYLKSASDLKKGYSLPLLNKLLGCDASTSNNVLHYLTSKKLIDASSDNADRVSLTWQGIDYVTELRKGKQFKRIHFRRAVQLLPKTRYRHGFLFWYDIVHEDDRTEHQTLVVYLSDVLIGKWWLYFYENPRESEKIMLRFGVNYLVEKIKNGIVNKHEVFELVAPEQPAKCPYDPALLTETILAEYEISVNTQYSTQPFTMSSPPKAFISYAWESEAIKQWVKNLATLLRQQGINAKIDQWEVVPGDQMPHFMEKSIRDNDFVLLICSPAYKRKSEARTGGVGYEGDIIAAEILQHSNHRKFIPILYSGDKNSSIPSSLLGKYYVDLSSDSNYEKNFEDLLATLLNRRETAPPLGKTGAAQPGTAASPAHQANEEEPIRIKGILVNEVSEPRNGGSQGSALYDIPFELSRRPAIEWEIHFLNAWNRPPQFTQRHRPGIATVSGNKIILQGTTIEEVEQVHKSTLKLAVEVANKEYSADQARKRHVEERQRMQAESHKRNIEEASRRIKFDD